MKTFLAALLALSCATPALAQYDERQYERPPGYDQDQPPPGYYPDRNQAPPRYDGDRNDGDRYEGDRNDGDRYRKNRGRDRRVVLGGRCEVFLNTGYGPQRLICRIIRAKPIGQDCACPTLPDGPNGPPGPYAGGHTVQ